MRKSKHKEAQKSPTFVTDASVGFEWNIRVNLHDMRGNVSGIIEETFYAPTYNEAFARANSLGARAVREGRADFWTVADVV